MSVLPYWKERLRQRVPLYSEALLQPGVTFKPRHGDDAADTWPHSVTRASLFQDYCYWFEDVYLVPYRAAEYYQQDTDRLPKPVDELAFFTTMSPWLYIVGKPEQVRTYLVPIQERIDGEWVKRKAHRYFVRLLAWKAHVAAFELQTGVVVDSVLLGYTPNNAQALETGRRDFMDALAANRENMQRSMGVLDTAG